MGNEKGRRKPVQSEKDERVVMMACCPKDEDAEKIEENVLLRIGEKLEGRSNVVMTRLSDEDLQKMDALVEVEVFKS